MEHQYETFADNIAQTLADSNVIHLSGTINEEQSLRVASLLSYMEVQARKQPVRDGDGKLLPAGVEIYLNSPGGYITEGFAIYDRIKLAQKNGLHVSIIAHGACQSAAMFILQAADKRLAGPNTTFLLHELSMGVRGSKSQIEDETKEAKRLDKRIADIICGRSGMSLRQLRTLTKRKNYTFDTEKALSHGLIDEVVG